MSFPPWQVNFPQNIGPNRRIEQNQESSVFNEQLEDGLTTVFPDFYKDNYINQWRHADSQVISSGADTPVLWNGTNMTGRTSAVQPHFTQATSSLTCTRTGVYNIQVNIFGSHLGGAVTEFTGQLKIQVAGATQSKQTFLFKSGDPGFQANWTGTIVLGNVVQVLLEQSTGTDYTIVDLSSTCLIHRVE